MEVNQNWNRDFSRHVRVAWKANVNPCHSSVGAKLPFRPQLLQLDVSLSATDTTSLPMARPLAWNVKRYRWPRFTGTPIWQIMAWEAGLPAVMRVQVSFAHRPWPRLLSVVSVSATSFRSPAHAQSSGTPFRSLSISKPGFRMRFWAAFWAAFWASFWAASHGAAAARTTSMMSTAIRGMIRCMTVVSLVAGGPGFSRWRFAAGTIRCFGLSPFFSAGLSTARAFAVVGAGVGISLR